MGPVHVGAAAVPRGIELASGLGEDTALLNLADAVVAEISDVHVALPVHKHAAWVVELRVGAHLRVCKALLPAPRKCGDPLSGRNLRTLPRFRHCVFWAAA